MKILVTPTSMRDDGSAAMERLKAFCPDLVWNPEKRPLTEEALIPLLQDCDGYLAGLDSITASVLAACPRLKAISRYGVGVDRVDLDAAQQRGVLVSNTPGANARAVAELTFGLILSLARKLPALDRSVRAGEWRRSTGMELGGKTLGILGLGAIGRRVAAIAAGFSMDVVAYDPYFNEAYAAAHGIRGADLDTVLVEADVVSLHLPATPETRSLISAERLAGMKPGALLVNASRGGLIDEDAAMEALASGQLGGLGLDAFREEPPTDKRLLGLDNVVLTPHTGAHTAEAVSNMAGMAVDNLIALLTQGTCPYLINRR